MATVTGSLFASSTSRIAGLCAAIALAGLVFDALLPLGIAAGIPYIAVVLLGMWLPWREAPLVLAAVGTALVGLGVVISPGPVEPTWVVAVNRGLSLLALWAAAVLAHLQLRAQAARRDSEARLRSVFETAPDGIVVIDEAGIIESFNPAAERLFGHGAAEVLGRPVSMLMPEPDASRHDSYIRTYLETGERRIIGIGREVRAKRRDGGTFPAELAVDELWVDGRRLFTGFLRDLSARREAEARARRVQAELHRFGRLTEMGEMVSVLAHELRQPLAAAMNYVQAAGRTLEQGATDGAQRAQPLLDKAEAQAERAAEIIGRLRGFLRPDGSQPTPQDVNGLVEEAVDLALMGTSAQGIEVERDLAPGLPPIALDRIQIQQVLVNLLRNAVDAVEAAERRRIEVATRARDGELEIAVRDNGCGIPAELEADLYQAFASTKANGTGLGLPISRGIVEAHGGRLWHEPASGGGTVFRVALPMADQERLADAS